MQRLKRSVVLVCSEVLEVSLFDTQYLVGVESRRHQVVSTTLRIDCSNEVRFESLHRSLHMHETILPSLLPLKFLFSFLEDALELLDEDLRVVKDSHLFGDLLWLKALLETKFDLL